MIVDTQGRKWRNAVIQVAAVTNIEGVPFKTKEVIQSVSKPSST